LFLGVGDSLYIRYRYLAPLDGWPQNCYLRVTIELILKPGRPLTYSGIAAILQKPAQPQQMQGVIFSTLSLKKPLLIISELVYNKPLGNRRPGRAAVLHMKSRPYLRKIHLRKMVL
jgi:hypothetical protein